jgi:hypothetical protein
MNKSAAEEKGLELSREITLPFYKRNSFWGAFVLAFAISANFALIYKTQEDTRVQAATAKKVADVAAQAAYKNCVITRALERWSRGLGHLNLLDANESKAYVLHRHQIYDQLHQTLLAVDGVDCVNPITIIKKEK